MLRRPLDGGPTPCCGSVLGRRPLAKFAAAAIRFVYDLQGIFTRLLARGGENGARLHNLVKETGEMCWGFDFAGHNHPYAVNSSILLPHHPGETRIALAADAVGGPLRCSLPERPGPMLPVGAMSFTWPSFKEMMRRPEALWYGPGVRRWFTRTYCEERAASRGWNPLASVCRRAADCTLEPPCHARGVERARSTSVTNWSALFLMFQQKP